MGYFQLGRCYPRGYKGSRIQGFKGNAKELQRFEGLAKVIRTLFRDILNNSIIPKGRKTNMDYIRMLFISYGSVWELETQISLAEDLD